MPSRHLAGVAPIPASSEQVQRVRLNRGGNRQLLRPVFRLLVEGSEVRVEAA